MLSGSTPHTTLTGSCLALEGRLEQCLSLPVDLVVVNGTPIKLVHHTRRASKPLDDDLTTRARFEVRVRGETSISRPTGASTAVYRAS